MKSKLYQCLAFAALLLFGGCAEAAITCSVSSNGFIAGFNVGTQTIVQTSFTVSCTRDATSDPTSVNYSNAANNGLYPNGINNRALLSGSNYLRYDAFVDSGCATQWKGANTIAGSISFSGTGTVSKVHNFWGCIAAGAAVPAAGTYTDTVTMTLSYGPTPQATASGTFPVTIISPATCSINPAPGTLAFGTYVAFGSALAGSSGFGITCSKDLPYTLSVSPTGGTIAGVNYTLLLNATATTLNLTGTGVQQNQSIDGSMAAGQAGTCAAGTCSATVPHTLTLTY